jgi:acyl carrier protein
MSDALASRIRSVIAEHFGVPSDRLRNESRLRDDLGADRFDRIELMIAIEDRVSGIAIDDAKVDEIQTVGDLMLVVEGLATVQTPGFEAESGEADSCR